jgi:hypothetical protein
VVPLWVYVAVAACSFLGLSGLTGLGLARVLGVIGREISDLYERDYWADLSTREP